MHIKTQGLILREVNYKDGDKILTVFSRDTGKCTVHARNCRRKGSTLAASAQLLVWSDMELFEHRDRMTLNEANSLEQFWGVRSDLEKLSLASYFSEVTELVSEEGRPDGALLSLILNCLYGLDKLNRPLSLIKAAFEWKLLCLAGYEPTLDACAICGIADPIQPQFNLREGLLYCATCAGRETMSVPLDQGSLSALRHVAFGNPKQIFSFRAGRESLRLMGNCTELFLLTQFERGFHTLDFYKQIQITCELGS